MKVEGGQRSGVRIIGTVQLKWNNTLRARAIVGTNPRGSRSSDGVTDQTKKRNKGDLGVARNKELSMGKRTGSKLVWNDITKAVRIGNHVVIGNWSGIDWEWP